VRSAFMPVAVTSSTWAGTSGKRPKPPVQPCCRSPASLAPRVSRDNAGSVYVSEVPRGNRRVLKLPVQSHC
jgi:hypothetical protein